MRSREREKLGREADNPGCRLSILFCLVAANAVPSPVAKRRALSRVVVGSDTNIQRGLAQVASNCSCAVTFLTPPFQPPILTAMREARVHRLPEVWRRGGEASLLRLAQGTPDGQSQGPPLRATPLQDPGEEGLPLYFVVRYGCRPVAEFVVGLLPTQETGLEFTSAGARIFFPPEYLE